MARTKVTIKPLKINTKDLDQQIRDMVGNRIVEVAVVNAPTDTGYYKSKIYFDGADTVIASAEYSAAIEYGFDNYQQTVKAHESRRGSKTFVVKEYTRTVNRKPNPNMRTAAAAVQKEVPALVNKILKLNGLG